MANCILDPQRDCLGLARAEMLEKQVEEYREKSSKDHREMYDRIRQLEIANAKTDTQYGQIMETLGALKSDIAELKTKPARRWDAVVDKILLAVIGAIVVYIMSQVGF